MAKKAKGPSGNSGGTRKRFLNDEECKQTAGRISDQLRRYPELKAAWDRSTCQACVADVVPIWGPDMETVKAKVALLFHPAEAQIINANLAA